MIDIKKEFGSVVLGLIYVILFITGVRYFGLSYFQIYLLICGISLVKAIYSKSKPMDWVKNCFYVAIMFIVLKFLGKYGIIGYFLSCFGIAAWIIYKRWDKYMEIKYHIESMIWGKPLKEFVKEGKKPPKLEFSL